MNKHTCEYMVGKTQRQRKSGGMTVIVRSDVKPCGKPATEYIEVCGQGIWYCEEHYYQVYLNKEYERMKHISEGKP